MRQIIGVGPAIKSGKELVEEDKGEFFSKIVPNARSEQLFADFRQHICRSLVFHSCRMSGFQVEISFPSNMLAYNLYLSVILTPPSHLPSLPLPPPLPHPPNPWSNSEELQNTLNFRITLPLQWDGQNLKNVGLQTSLHPTTHTTPDNWKPHRISLFWWPSNLFYRKRSEKFKLHEQGS